MKKLKCCIIDDEPLAQELIKGYVEQTPFWNLLHLSHLPRWR